MSDKQRGAFEKCFYEEIGGASVNETLAWEVWQAAIASVVVSIPEQESNGMLHPSDVKAAIEQAGVGYE